jgi:malonyl-CoA O-methyltransferase
VNGLFVTGTDTGVGKTVVCAALMHRLRRHGAVRYWKPVQTGVEIDDDTATVRALGACAAAEIFDAGVRLPRPVSPHLAARLAGCPIDLAALVAQARAEDDGRRWIVEGAGGPLVPLDHEYFMIDLMARLGAPILVVARTNLGTINHTLLTLDALRARRLPIAGVVMAGDPSPDNRAAIEAFGAVPVLGELPRLEPLTADALRAWVLRGLDPERRLAS